MTIPRICRCITIYVLRMNLACEVYIDLFSIILSYTLLFISLSSSTKVLPFVFWPSVTTAMLIGTFSFLGTQRNHDFHRERSLLLQILLPDNVFACFKVMFECCIFFFCVLYLFFYF